MSSGSQTMFNDSKALYCYVVIAALSIVVFIGFMLFWRSRIVEARMRLLRPAIPLSPRADPERKLPPRPRLYDAYLDWDWGARAGVGGEVWREVMPLCAHQYQHEPFVGPPTPKHCPDPDFGAHLRSSAAAPLTLAVLIAMPVPTPLTTQSREDREDDDRLPPYVEFGMAGHVQVH
ncbi:hypothetical protein DFH08DRAFT_1024629 [Mycena albidolilacea]|uniref:Uncharacterized protein n=1 Tax=Mycena albidolilacea TaxID=1033008 RepID=A0AAD7F0F0_9AGAR|nr:hypothetical protein DFH08DRAFT_1024629 [Mycena albidolilacea]